MGTTYEDYADAQDTLRPLRMFVGAAAGLLQASDQSFANQDAYAVNLPRQFYSVGANGSSIEGTPVAVARSGAIVISPMLVFIGIGVAAALLLRK